MSEIDTFIFIKNLHSSKDTIMKAKEKLGENIFGILSAEGLYTEYIKNYKSIRKRPSRKNK